MDGQVLLHRFRYHLGCGFITPTDIVLDLGSGHGYGTKILAGVAKFVTGYDFDKRNIHTGNTRHKVKNNKFVKADLETAKLKNADVATSFEVIEHLYKPYDFIQKIKSKIRKFIVVSVPIGERLHEVDGDIQVIGDWSHHSVFPSQEDLDKMFVDENWGRFYGIRSGVTYIAVYYNKNQYEN